MKVELDHLFKSFDDKKKVLSDLCFEEDVDTLAIIGPSGGGKSTLLRILGGLILADSGKVCVDGKDPGKSEKELLDYRRSIGFVFQREGLFHHMTAKENIVKPLEAVHGFTKKDAENRADNLLDKFGLKEDKDKIPAALSGGQQQRISIARAIAPKPSVLLLDEPTSALDTEYTTEVLDMINELRRDDIRFIIVTHEMGFARHACEKAAFLNNGIIEEAGYSEDIFAHPQSDGLRRFLDKILEWNI